MSPSYSNSSKIAPNRVFRLIYSTPTTTEGLRICSSRLVLLVLHLPGQWWRSCRSYFINTSILPHKQQLKLVVNIHSPLPVIGMIQCACFCHPTRIRRACSISQGYHISVVRFLETTLKAEHRQPAVETMTQDRLIATSNNAPMECCWQVFLLCGRAPNWEIKDGTVGQDTRQSIWLKKLIARSKWGSALLTFTEIARMDGTVSVLRSRVLCNMPRTSDLHTSILDTRCRTWVTALQTRTGDWRCVLLDHRIRQVWHWMFGYNSVFTRWIL